MDKLEQGLDLFNHCFSEYSFIWIFPYIKLDPCGGGGGPFISETALDY